MKHTYSKDGTKDIDLVKVIIFDFDGTIADTLQSVIGIINRLSDKFGYKKVTKESLDILKNKKPEEVLKDLGISITKLPFIIRKIKTELNREIESLKPIVSIEKTLLELKKNRYKLGILTSNSKDNVSKFLKRNSLDLFNFIYSGSSIFGKSKVIKDFLKNQNLKPKEIIYVGDEIRDIEAAKRSNIMIVAVSWGANSKQMLKKQNPDFLIDKPEELIEILCGS